MAVQYEGIRQMFTREALLASSWYAERLRTKQRRDKELWTRHVKSLRAAGSDQLAAAMQRLARINSSGYLDDLRGTIGADSFHYQF